MTSPETGSYRIGQARFRDSASELARLEHQAGLAWPQELRTLERHGLHKDASVLEAGCGPGFVTKRLLDYLQHGSVTGLDVDSTMVAHARELLAGSDRVRFVERSADDTGLPDESFDVVYVRFVLQHVPNVEAVVAECRRVLRPGGRLIVADADAVFSVLFDPQPSFFPGLIAAVAETQRQQGGNATMARRVPRLLADAGFSGIAIDAVITHSVLVGRDAIRRVIPIQALDHMEAVGVISPELAATARDYVARLDSGEKSFDGMYTFLVVSGTK